MSPEQSDTLEMLAQTAIKEANLSPAEVSLVREGIIASLEVLADTGYTIAPEGMDINFELPVSIENRAVLEEVVRDSIQSLNA
ncbi:hypothetical protein JXD20_03850 [Candidatus Peregrinibacteria bacterium]|nr:hypothetical protein [Candidatus Peregrinibacteria bacterium]